MDARFAPSERSYSQIRSDLVRTRSVATGYRQACDEDLPVTTLMNLHKGILHLRTRMIGLYSPAVGNLATALHDHFGEPNYNLLADLQAFGLFIQAVLDEVINLAPQSADGSINERTLDPQTGEYVQATIPVAQLATLRNALDAVIADIQI